MSLSKIIFFFPFTLFSLSLKRNNKKTIFTFHPLSNYFHSFNFLSFHYLLTSNNIQTKNYLKGETYDSHNYNIMFHKKKKTIISWCLHYRDHSIWLQHLHNRCEVFIYNITKALFDVSVHLVIVLLNIVSSIS
jgi:hypothetical protein